MLQGVGERVDGVGRHDALLDQRGLERHRPHLERRARPPRARGVVVAVTVVVAAVFGFVVVVVVTHGSSR